MKPTMFLKLRISTDSCQNQRFSEDDFLKEFDDDNIKIDRRLIIRISDGAIMGEILTDGK